MCRRSSRRWTVMPSAPPRTASTAAATGSGSLARRARRSVATWSMLTPSRIMRSGPVVGFLGHFFAVAGRLAGEDLVGHDGEDDVREAFDEGPDERQPAQEEPGQDQARDEEDRGHPGQP